MPAPEAIELAVPTPSRPAPDAQDLKATNIEHGAESVAAYVTRARRERGAARLTQRTHALAMQGAAVLRRAALALFELGSNDSYPRLLLPTAWCEPASFPRRSSASFRA
ncbi:hypothetical protein PsYK624_095720 [Phanerochaete sordida]|uniref:Uncharacterized protein n=1 Tax=Phanerochaete sordida TaxID=48140 RepID=A0A9P3GEH1_9APHY|nr:hypothetical protein PsYK624_095720 [Phanerochaete sordida]